MNLKEKVESLVTVDDLRKHCGIKLTNDDRVSLYTASFTAGRCLEQLDDLYVKPILIAIGKELAKHCRIAEVGEPAIIVEDRQVTIYFPVLEKGSPTIFLTDGHATFGDVKYKLTRFPKAEVLIQLAEVYSKGIRSGYRVVEIPYTEQTWNVLKMLGERVV